MWSLPLTRSIEKAVIALFKGDCPSRGARSESE